MRVIVPPSGAPVVAASADVAARSQTSAQAGQTPASLLTTAPASAHTLPPAAPTGSTRTPVKGKDRRARDDDADQDPATRTQTPTDLADADSQPATDQALSGNLPVPAAHDVLPGDATASMSQTAPFLTPWQSTSWTLAQAGQVGGQATAEAAGLGAASATAAGTAAGAGTALQMPGMLPVLGGTGLVALAMHDWDRRPAQPAQTPPDPRAPQLVSVQGKAAEDSLILRFDEAIDASRLPDAQAFEVVQAGRTLSVTRVEVNGQEVTLRLDGDLREGAFSLSYTDPSSADDAQALQDSSGNDIASLMRGVVADGYILGAKIYVDQDGDGLPDPEEDTGVSTGADGSFLLSAQAFSHPLLAVGGINIDMGLPNTMVLQGAAGSGVINPLSTLVMRLARQDGLEPEAAAQRLALALDLQPPAGVSLVDYDPLADTGLAAVRVQVAAAQLATLLNLAGASDSQQTLLLDSLALQISASAVQRQDDADAAPLDLAAPQVIEMALTAASLNAAAASDLAGKLASLANADSLTELTLAQSAALGLPVPADGAGAPALKIGASRLQLKAGEEPVISFAFSEQVQGFALSDVSVTGGSLSALTELLPGRVYTARLSPTPGRSGEVVLSVSGVGYTDGSANTGASDARLSLNVDSQGPMATFVRITPKALKAGETAEVAFVFDEPVAFVDLKQVQVSQGTLSGLTASEDRKTYTATYTPPAETAKATVIIELPAAAYLDAAGNRGAVASVGSSVEVDTRQPLATLSLSPETVRAGSTATLSVAFDEAIERLDTEAVKASAGTLSNWTQVSAQLWTATFTPAPDAPASVVTVSLPASAYQDLAGNTGGINETALGFSVDTALPTLTLTSELDTLKAGQTTGLRFEFSEAVQGFDASDVQLAGGSLSQWRPATGEQAGKVFTATFTPDADQAGPTGSVKVAASAYADLVGNAGSGEQGLSLQIDTLAPAVSSISANGAQDRISLTFDSALDTSALPLASDFSVVQGGRALTPSTISASGRVLTLGGLTGLESGPFTLSYTDTAGDGTAQIQDLAGNDAGSFVQGIVADGYIRGAKIYIDANRDGIAQDSEYTGVNTGLDGSFVLPQRSVVGPILAVGGVNIDTGVPNTLTLSAPAGALVINPLTTLVTEVARTSANTDPELAASRVAQALGLTGVDLLTLDPLASGEGLAVQKQAAKVATLLMAAMQDAPQKQAQLVSALAQAVNEHLQADASQPLALADATVLQQVLERAGLSEPEAAASLLSNLQTLANASDFSAVSKAQALALDRTAPAAPVFEQVLIGGAGIAPQLTFRINTRASDGSAATAGDVLTVRFEDANLTIDHVLTSADLARGLVSVEVSPTLLDLPFEAQLMDRASQLSATSTRNQDANRLDLSDALSPLVQMLLDGAGRLDLPMIGNLGDQIGALSAKLLDSLAALPSLVRVQAAPSMPASPRLLAASALSADLSSDWSDDEFISGGDADSSWELLDPIVPDQDWDLPDPIVPGQDWDLPDPINPAPYIDTLPLPDTVDPNWQGDPPDGSSNLEGFEWIERKFSIDNFTGENYLSLVGAWNSAPHPMQMSLGGANANLALDASVDGRILFDLRLVTKPLESREASITGKYVAVDTSKSWLKFAVAGGLQPESQASGTLGPLSLTFTDQDSTRVVSDTDNRANTFLRGSVELRLQDNDALPTDDLLALNKATLSKLLTEAQDPANFKLGDWASAQVGLKGQLSGHTQLLLDFSKYIDGNEALAPLVDFLRMNLQADITVPLDLKYDSTLDKQGVQDYGRIYLDNLSTGVQPLVRGKLGTAVELMDSNLDWLFKFKDFMYETSPVGLIQSAIPSYSMPEPLPGWLTKLLPGDVKDTEYAKSLEYSVWSLVTGPSRLLNDGITWVNGIMDDNKDGRVSNFELIKALAVFYYRGVENLDAAWSSVQTIPGVRTGLAGSGIGSAVLALLDGLKLQKPVLETALQGIAVMQDMLASIDQLDQLSQSYLAASEAVGKQPSLQLPLGSYLLDFKNSSWQSLTPSFDNKALNYLYPLPTNPEPTLTAQAALERLLDLADNNTADDSNAHVYVFLAAGLEGVNPVNVAALRDILNSPGVTADRLKLNYGGKTVRPPSDLGTSDGLRPVDGIQDEIDAYRLVIDLVNQVPYRLDPHYSAEQLRIFTAGGRDPVKMAQHEDNGYKNNILKAFETLGLISANFATDTATSAVRMNSGSAQILYSILKQQNFRDIDTIGELQGLWNVKNKLEAINGYRYVLNPANKPKDEVEPTLTLQDLALLKLSLIGSQPESRLKSVTQALKDYTGEASGLYNALAKAVDDVNAPFVRVPDESSPTTWPFWRIEEAAKLNTAQTLDLGFFKSLGMAKVNSNNLHMLQDVLNTDYVGPNFVGPHGSASLSYDNVLTIANSVNTLYAVVGNESVSTSNFEQALKTLLAPGSYDAFAATGNTPLLMSLLADRTWSEVDTLAKLNKLISVAQDITWTSLSDGRLYEASSDLYKQRVAYEPQLNAADMALIGFDGLSDDEVARIVSSLKTQLYRSGASAPAALDITQFHHLVETETTNGFFADLLADPAIRAFWDKIHDLGFAFPVLRQESNLLEYILRQDDPDQSLNVLDLMTFTPNLPAFTPVDNPSISYDFFDLSYLKLTGSAEADLGLVPRITLGIDTLGINSLLDSVYKNADRNVAADLLNSLYLSDNLQVGADGTVVDLPEFEAWAHISGLLKLTLGSTTGMLNAYAQAGAGLNFDLALDLKDPDGDGKARALDLIQQGLSGGLKEMLDAQFKAYGQLKAEAGVKLDLAAKDGLPGDWSSVAGALFDTGLKIWKYFGNETQFNQSIGQTWDFPIYDATRSDSIFGV